MKQWQPQTTNAGLQISQASKNIRKVPQVILWYDLLSKFSDKSFQEYVR